MKVVYSTPSCKACSKLKEQYRREGIEFEEIMIGKDITMEEFKALYPTVRSVPYVIEVA